jgi:hypothetical protein
VARTEAVARRELQRRGGPVVPAGVGTPAVPAGSGAPAVPGGMEGEQQGEEGGKGGEGDTRCSCREKVTSRAREKVDRRWSGEESGHG